MLYVCIYLLAFVIVDKMRHRDTHKLQTHKLGVRVEGWHKIDPVSVDRVGIYFRQVSPDYNSGVSYLYLLNHTYLR